MSLLRYNISFAFLEPLKPQVRQRLSALAQELRMLKKEAVIINEGKNNEENTNRAKKHICYHDETPTRTCEPEEDI